MLRRTLLLVLPALGALVALPALALGQSSLFDETEPDATVTNVKVNDHKGVAKVYFDGTDPVDAPEDLSYDCSLDGGDQGADDEGEGDDLDDEGGDESDDEDEFHAARSKGGGEIEVDCPSPWVLKDLEPGRHTVEVTAFDEEFNEDSTPASAQFKVKKPKR